MLELNIQLQCKKNDTIEQLQMGVSTIATALALLCRASTVATFVGKNGRGKRRYRLYIRQGLAPFANVFSWIRKFCQFANIFFRGLFPLYGMIKTFWLWKNVSKAQFTKACTCTLRNSIVDGHCNNICLKNWPQMLTKTDLFLAFLAVTMNFLSICVWFKRQFEFFAH